MVDRDRLVRTLDILKKEVFKGCEIELRPQSGGFSNADNFKISVDGKDFLLRFLPESTSKPTKMKELFLTKLASDLNISPKLIFQDKEHYFAVIEYIEGRTLVPKDLADENILSQKFEHIQKMHQQEFVKEIKAVSIISQIQSLFEKIANAERWLEKLCQDFEFVKYQHETKCQLSFVFIHNDLWINNMMIDTKGDVWFIDWTDAGMGCIYSDLSMLGLATKKDKLLKVLSSKLDIEFDSEIYDAFVLIRLFKVTMWGVYNAQLRAQEELFSPELLDDFSTDNRNVLEFLSDFAEGKVPTDSAEDFINIAKFFYQCFLQQKALVREPSNSLNT